MKCPDCADPGVFQGNGKCEHCYGSGKVGTIANDLAGGKQPCPQCGGTGRCNRCDGKGIVADVFTAPKRPYATAELNPLDDKIAVKVCCPK